MSAHERFQRSLMDHLFPLLLLPGFLAGPQVASATVSFDTIGFKDDVDLIVDGAREFLVIPQESEDGSSARVTIMDLDPGTGAPDTETAYTSPVYGFENGVDPFITRCGGEHTIVIVPMESEDGEQAAIKMFRVDPITGAPLDSLTIELGNLGFRQDVDGTWYFYDGGAAASWAVAFFALESADGSEQGVIAIDVWNGAPDADWGGCSLLSTDGRAGCGETLEVDWLPGLAIGVDPIAYQDPVGGELRLAVPVTGPGGSDLLILTYDPNEAGGSNPLFEGPHVSVKDLNAGTASPTNFPGFERDVDIALGPCGTANMLVPVEDPSGDGDLYFLDADGNSEWVLSIDGDLDGKRILGFEAGVDMLLMCGLGGVNPDRVVVPLENSEGTDADLWIVDLADGELLARAEDPAVNPGLTIPGYEVGVDPFPWSGSTPLILAEGLDGIGELMLLNADAVLLESDSYEDVGFVRSVDPVVSPISGSPLFVPVAKSDGSDSDILMYSTYPDLDAPASLEALNAAFGVTFSGFEWDVDLGTARRTAPGAAWVYLPEEDPTGAPARVRFEPVPTTQHGDDFLVVATQEVGGLPATLYFFHANTGSLEEDFADVYGLETGLDMANGRGPMRRANPPNGVIPPGQDADTDPTGLPLIPVGLECFIDDFDVGNLWCSITNQGTFGFMDASQDQGVGFMFPRNGVNRLYLGSLCAGTSVSYVVNRDYGPDADWEREGCLVTGGGGVSDQESVGSYWDSGHPSPRGLKIVQEGFAWATAPDDDYVILSFNATNTGANPLAGLWVGPFMDWDLDGLEGYNQNQGGVDPARDLVYMWREGGGDGTYVGIKSLSHRPVGQMTLIHNPTYVYPQGHLQDSDRFHFLSGDAPSYVVHTTPTPSDWSAIMGVGPLNLAPGASAKVWLALLAGTSLADLKSNADAAQARYDEMQSPAEVPADPVGLLPDRVSLWISPNPSHEETTLTFDLPNRQAVTLDVFDVRGRRLARLIDATLAPGRHAFVWEGEDPSRHRVTSGVYYARLRAATETRVRRITLLR